MGIKLHEQPTQLNGSYPYLAKFKGSSKAVYWMTALGCGIKISGNGKRVVGTYTTDLNTNPDNWEVLPKGTSFTFTQE